MLSKNEAQGNCKYYAAIENFTHIMRGERPTYDDNTCSQIPTKLYQEAKTYYKNIKCAMEYIRREERLNEALEKSNITACNNTTCSLGGIAHLITHLPIPQRGLHGDISSEYDNAKKIAIEFLLNNDLDPNLKDANGHTFIEAAIMGVCDGIGLFKPNNREFILELIRLAKEHGLNVNTKDNKGNTIVHNAISSLYCYKVNILDIIEALGPDFDINAKNNDGKDIIDYLDYYIKEGKPLNGNWDYNTKFTKDEINKWRTWLKNQREEIVNYIQTMNNPLATNPATKDTFMKALTTLEKLIKANIRLNTFIGYPISTVSIDKATITLEKIDRLLAQELSIKKTNTLQATAVTIQTFGQLAPEIINFILLGTEPSTISFYQLGEKTGDPYPSKKTLIEKIKWLHDAMYKLTQMNQQENNEKKKMIKYTDRIIKKPNVSSQPKKYIKTKRANN